MRTELEKLFDEVRKLWHVLEQVGTRLHAEEEVTLGMRGVLEFLWLGGPATVPQLARSRSVTRQHVQVLVNSLRELGLIALTPNPGHQRSALLQLTAAGRQTLERMLRREHRWLGKTGLEVDEAGLRRAAHTLAKVRAALGGTP